MWWCAAWGGSVLHATVQPGNLATWQPDSQPLNYAHALCARHAAACGNQWQHVATCGKPSSGNQWLPHLSMSTVDAIF
ncbi:hypothetical protein ACLKA6_019240 [Drosophila palustris]